MLYYDNKISQLESLAKEIKTTLETIQTSLSKSAIKTTLNDNFEEMKNETLQELLESSTQKQNELLALIETKKAELESANNEKIEQTLTNIATENLKDLIDLNIISQNIEQSKEISAEIIKLIDADKIAQIAQENLDKEAILKKIVENIDLNLQALSKEIFNSEKYAYFRDLIRKTQIYASQNILAVSNAIYLIQNRVLELRELEFNEALSKKKSVFYTNLTRFDNPTFNNIIVVR